MSHDAIKPITTQSNDPGNPPAMEDGTSERVRASEDNVRDCTDTYCVIGAGPSGITAVKNLAQAGIKVQGFEAQDDVGGNWYFGSPASSVYESTHLISSKKLIEYTDYPMRSDYPHYPSHEQALEYLRGYARHFDLYPLIQFNTRVKRVEKAGERWQVRLNDGTTRLFAGVVIANGHHHVPNRPDLPGRFTGRVLHSHDYKTAEQLRDQRVLVVGAGNSGCDIAVDASRAAKKTYISMRRGYHFIPKFLRGMPSDVLHEILLRWRVPLWIRRRLLQYGISVTFGKPANYGLQTPEHRFLETHPIVNSQLIYCLGHGTVTPLPGIFECRESNVSFVNGENVDVDTIVLATGYKIVFPFIEPELLNAQDGLPRLYLNAFHPHEDSLFVVGMIQPDSGIWGLADVQSQIIARFIVAQKWDEPRTAWFRQLKSGEQPDLGNGIHYVDSSRHRIEVEHFSYRRRLEKIAGAFSRHTIVNR